MSHVEVPCDIGGWDNYDKWIAWPFWVSFKKALGFPRGVDSRLCFLVGKIFRKVIGGHKGSKIDLEIN
jgi:hypothetical protein